MKKIVPLLCLALLSACDQAPTKQLDNPGTVISDVAPQAKVVPLPVGVTGKGEGVELTINNLKDATYVGPEGMGIKAEPGEIFVAASYTIKNVSDRNLPLLERPSLTLTDGEGKQYVADDAVGGMAAITDQSVTSMDLTPGTSTKAWIGWKIAKAGFDKSKWRIVAETEPRLIFALK